MSDLGPGHDCGGLLVYIPDVDNERSNSPGDVGIRQEVENYLDDVVKGRIGTHGEIGISVAVPN